MRSVVFSLSVLMLGAFSVDAETYKHPAEYSSPELIDSLAKTYSLKTMHTCEEATRLEAKASEVSFDAPLMDDLNSHVIFWNRGSDILSRAKNFQATELLDADEKYLEALIFAPSQKNFTARDKVFLIEQGWARKLDDKEFVRSTVFGDCNQKMTRAISDYLASMSEKGEAK